MPSLMRCSLERLGMMCEKEEEKMKEGRRVRRWVVDEVDKEARALRDEMKSVEWWVTKLGLKVNKEGR